MCTAAEIEGGGGLSRLLLFYTHFSFEPLTTWNTELWVEEVYGGKCRCQLLKMCGIFKGSRLLYVACPTNLQPFSWTTAEEKDFW
jgi:hypothetical protein